MQEDGNAVIYNSKNNPIWASMSQERGSKPYKFSVQNDGNLVI